MTNLRMNHQGKKSKTHHIPSKEKTYSDSSEDDCKIIRVIPNKQDLTEKYETSSDECPNQMQDKHVVQLYDEALQSSDGIETDRETCHSEEF